MPSLVPRWVRIIPRADFRNWTGSVKEYAHIILGAWYQSDKTCCLGFSQELTRRSNRTCNPIMNHVSHARSHDCSASLNQQCATTCIVKGEAQKSPLFWRFSGGFWFSQDRLFSRNSPSKPLNLIKCPIFTNTPCKSTCLYNAPSMHTFDWNTEKVCRHSSSDALVTARPQCYHTHSLYTCNCWSLTISL